MEQSRAQKQAEKLKASQDEVKKEDFLIQQCFKGKIGEDALKILKKLFYDRISFKRGEPDYTAFREGQRDVCGFIIEAIERGRHDI